MQDLWFAPKRCETTARYERLGVLIVKRYVPTGDDFVIRRYAVRIADMRSSLDSLIRYERLTRRPEAVHELVFLRFVGFSLWRVRMGQTTRWGFGFALAVYLVLILSPAKLQRYNRLRVSPIIQHLMTTQTPLRQAGVA